MNDGERLERVRAVTRYFAYWQGLKLVPAGVLVLGIGLMGSLQSSANPLAWAVLAGALLTACFLAYGFISAGYKRVFGVVRNPGVNVRLDKITVLVAAPLLIAVVLADIRLQPPVLLSCLGYAAFFVWCRWATGGGRPHYLWIAAAVALCAFAPLAGLDTGSGLRFLMVILGLGTVVAGVLDHFELLRIFKPVGDEVQA